MVEMPWRRDPAVLRERLDLWVRDRLGEDRSVTAITVPEGIGLSSETMMFTVVTDGTADCTTNDYVARIAPDLAGYTIFPEYDLALQRRCMQLIARHTALPVPAVPWHEEDPRWLGAPFLVMDRIDGVAPTDMPGYMTTGWLADATPAEQALVEHGAVAVLAGIHALTPATHDLAFLDRPQFGITPLEQHVAYQRWYYEWARDGVHYPLIERALDWLDGNRASTARTVLNWGDARMGNILWRDFLPVAVLDWEMAALGPPEVDVAWLIWLHALFQSNVERKGLLGMPDFLRREKVVARYEELTGVILDDLEWYDVLAMVRFAIISLRVSGRAIKFGQMRAPADPDDLFRFRGRLEAALSR